MPVFKIKQNGEWVDIAGGSGGGEIPDNLVYVSEENQESAIVPLDADTIGGKTENMLSVANADTIEGYSVNSLIDKIYPVGSIYMSVNAVSPDVLFGGTWEALQDRFLLGAGSTYAAGSTGGEAEHKHTDGDLRAMIGAVNNNTGSIGYMPTSAHNPNTGVSENVTMAINGSVLSVSGTNHYTRVVGYTSTDSNIPPYLSVYMWKRTA